MSWKNPVTGNVFSSAELAKLDDLNAKLDKDPNNFVLLDERSKLLGGNPQYSDAFLQNVNSGLFGDDTKSHFSDLIQSRLPANDVSYVNPTALNPNYSKSEDFWKTYGIYALGGVGILVLLAVLKR